MENPKRGGVEIILDRPRVLRFTLNSVIAFRRENQKDLDQVLAEIGQIFIEARRKVEAEEKDAQMSWAEVAMRLCQILRAALLHEDKELSLDAVADLIDAAPGEGLAQRILYVAGKATEAWTLYGSGEAAKKKLAEKIEAELEHLNGTVAPPSTGISSSGSASDISDSTPVLSGISR